MTPTEKRCTGCGETKALDDYGKHKNGKYGRNSKCKECSNARGKAWREANPDYLRGWRERNPNYSQEWARRNPDYRASRPHDRWAGSYRERARRYGYEPLLEHFTREDVVAAYGGRCWHCEAAPFEQLDHYPIPVAAGGPHLLGNVRPSCTACNHEGLSAARVMARGARRARGRRGYGRPIPAPRSTSTAGKSQAKSARRPA